MNQIAGRPAVFLDRDGVLNESVIKNGVPHPPESVDSFRLCDGVELACRQLVEAGLPLFVVTNQPDIARRTVTAESVNELNALLQALLPITEIAVCPHDDIDQCLCRKPNPGLLLGLAERYGIDLSRSVMVGDRWRDVSAGRAAGTGTVWIDRMHTEQKPTNWDYRCLELIEGVDWVLERTGMQQVSPREFTLKAIPT
jgi:D-glycero-D-manno-heptose 1,7-bisphosphate phosphatase